MSEVYVSYNNIVSTFGFDTEAALQQIKNGVSGLQLINDDQLLPNPFYTSLVSPENLQVEFKKLKAQDDYTRLEQMMLISLNKVIRASKVKLTNKVGLIISTTKGNIDALQESNTFPKNRAYLSELGVSLKRYFGFTTEPILLSNACVSGVLAIAVAKRMIRQGRFDMGH